MEESLSNFLAESSVKLYEIASLMQDLITASDALGLGREAFEITYSNILDNIEGERQKAKRAHDVLMARVESVLEGVE